MAQTTQDFTRIYDAYVAAAKRDDFRAMSALFSQELRSEIKTAEDRQEYMAMAKYLAPERYETLFLDVTDGGRKAELQAILTVRIPEQVQKEQNIPALQRAEVILRFVKEGAEWKWGGLTIIGDPEKRARPKDLKMGSRSDYVDSNTQVGGQILCIEKQTAGTVFIVRVLDEEIATFVEASKVSSDFVPGRVIEFRGAQHKSDKLKFWAEEVSLHKQ